MAPKLKMALRRPSLALLNLFLLLATVSDVAQSDSSMGSAPEGNLQNHQQQSSLQSSSSSGSPSSSNLYHSHQMGSDESIDVSSSIGVSVSGAQAPSSAEQGKVMHHAGHVEDLMANESGEGNGPRIISASAPQGAHPGQGLSHAVVLDTDQDLLGAETEPKFSLSKLAKRPFSRLPSFDSLRFNNRFFNGAASLLGSASNPQQQRIIPPFNQHNQQQQQQPFRQPPPPHMRGGPGPGPNYQGPPMRGGPNFHSQQHPQPIYNGMNLPLHLSQQQKPQQGPKGAQFSLPPQFQSGPNGGDDQPSIHLVEEPVSISVPAGTDQSDIMHSISDFIGSSDNDNARLNDVSNDFDSRPALSSPSNDIWPLTTPDLAKIVSLDVKCEKNFMKVSVEFDRPYNGMIFSKGHFSSPNCIHLPAGSGRTHVYFDIRMDSCGTSGSTVAASTALSGPGTSTGTYFENTVIFQYDPFLQEAWDQARKMRCTWHDQYEKSVSFRPFPVDMVDVVRADFAGDNVGCWMQIQVGRGPWASEVAGIVKIGQTMTMVLAIKDEENKFDMLVRNCVAHDGKRAPIELVDTHGCIVRSKLMSRFTKIKNFGSSASVLSYAHFQAFKFPDSMEVHFQCTIQICKNRCSDQCDLSGNSNLQYATHQISGTINTGSGAGNGNIGNHQIQPFGTDSLYLEGGHEGIVNRGPGESVLARPREIRDVSGQEGTTEETKSVEVPLDTSKDVGVTKVIRVVSSGDLSFPTSDKLTQSETSSVDGSTNSSSESGNQFDSAKSWLSERINEKICMSSLNFVVCFATLATLLLLSCSCSVLLCCRRRSPDECLKKTAKETALTAKMVLGAAVQAQHRAAHDYHQQAGGGGGVLVSGSTANATNAHAYLGSSSVLSPRVQATNYGHHRSSDMYHS